MASIGKPLGRKAYGSIPHLIGSGGVTPRDRMCNPGQQDILLGSSKKSKYYQVTVQEKLDGSCVAVYKNKNSTLHPLIRAGWSTDSSPYVQHHYFSTWVQENSSRFHQLLRAGDWAVGEWCIQAHGTRYSFGGEPFFLFDLFRNGERVSLRTLKILNNILIHPFRIAPVLYNDIGGIDINKMLSVLGNNGYTSAIDPAEGLVYRAEKDKKVCFLAKYVRPVKIAGLYLKYPTEQWNYWEGVFNNSIDHLKDRSLLK